VGVHTLGEFSLGRDALWWLITQELAGMKEVWLPEYCCPEVIRVFRCAQWKIRPYRLLPDFSADWDHLLDSLLPTRHDSLFLLIDFLGYTQDVPDKVAEALRLRFGAVVRDAAQGLPSEKLLVLQGSAHGYALFSLRKPLPIPDFALLAKASVGKAEAEGIVGFNQRSVGAPSISRRMSAQLELQKLRHPGLTSIPGFAAARWLLKRWGGYGHGPSLISRDLLPRFDIEEVARARRRNATKLVNCLGDVALYNSVGEGSSPYYFPILVDAPRLVKSSLAKLGIGATTLWGSRGFISPSPASEVCRSASQLLCLPVHQGMKTAEVEYLCEIATDVVLKVARRTVTAVVKRSSHTCTDKGGQGCQRK